jgi:hypothetical protein
MIPFLAHPLKVQETYSRSGGRLPIGRQAGVWLSIVPLKCVNKETIAIYLIRLFTFQNAHRIIDTKKPLESGMSRTEKAGPNRYVS